MVPLSESNCDTQRQLASAAVGGKTYSYEYNSSGIRTRKTNYDSSYTEYYVVEGLPVAEQRFKSNGTKQYILRYLYDEGNSPVGFGIYYPTASSPYWQYYYFGKNLQGDVIALYRSDYNSTSKTNTPTLVATYTYDPWGAPTGIYDANGSTISQTAYHVAAYNPFRYRGYRYDGDTRLYYLQSRYYDPAIGRFINADGYASTGQGLIGHNMFAYCNNTPTVMEDFAGKVPNYCIAVSDGAAGAHSEDYKPKPKLDMVKRRQYYKICATYNIYAPAGAKNVQIKSATVGTKSRTKLEHFVDGIPRLAGNLFLTCIMAEIPAGIPAKIATGITAGISIFSYAFELDSDPVPPSGTYKSINVVLEYDLVDPLTGVTAHYEEERSYIVWAEHNNTLYMDHLSTTYFYIGG